MRGLFASIVLLVFPLPASAHPLLDEAARRYAEADFAGAIEALAEAEASNDLSRVDLVALYTRRSLVRFAMQQMVEVEADLLRLLTLEPHLALPLDMPPAMQRSFERIRERIQQAITVRGRVERLREGLRIRAEVTGDVARIVRDVAVYARIGGGPWERGGDGELLVPTTSDRIEWYAEAIGPGAAIVAQHGGEDAPVRHEPLALHSPSDPDPEPESSGGVGWWIAGGALVAIAAAVAVVLVTSNGAAETDRFSGPTVTP